ncbi:MAG: hypothetical protein HKUEN07_26780 [Rhodocyclaceae bacterium]|nr:MAG: hypothetical protein HKUEN07_26780 [Rhodocyclaceae bacterium]
MNELGSILSGGAIPESGTYLIRVYGDSFSLPRPSDGISHKDVFAELLRSGIESLRPGLRVSVYNRSRGGAASTDLYALYSQDRGYFAANEKGILIIQCGINDCAPRPVPPRLRVMIGKLPTPLRWAIVKIIHYARPYLLRAGIRWYATEAERFEALLQRWLEEAMRESASVYVTTIVPVGDSVEKRSPGFSEHIRKYNEIIRSVCVRTGAVLIDTFQAIASDSGAPGKLLSDIDGYHITREGHELFSELILTDLAARSGK